MKFYTYCLTSAQLPPVQPSILNHWYFSDPVLGLTFTYPSTTYAGALTTLSACVSPTDSCFTDSVCGGFFFPWGYQVFDQYQTVTLGYNGLFKGDTTITFVPSCLDITYHDVFKISYDFGDGTTTSTQKNVLALQVFDSIAQYSQNIDFNSPVFTNTSHVFYASSVPVTYTPAITVFYGDMTTVFFNFKFTVVPNSIYEIDNVHLLNTVQLPQISNSSLNVLEIESETQVCDVIVGLSSR